MFKRPWHRLPTLLSVVKLAKFRSRMRKDNLHDTSQFPHNDAGPTPKPKSDDSHIAFRTADGSFNDLKQPQMGMAGTRFGRNVPVKDTHVDSAHLMTPNPREISRITMTRDEFRPATSLNVLAAAWIQFQNHGWFSHGDNQTDQRLNIPLADDDPWPQDDRPMDVGKTLDDPTRLDNDPETPPTFVNTVSHWWDGSQLYGSSEAELERLRSHTDGKLLINDDGLLPLDESSNIDRTGFNDNWWIGLSVLHTIFVKEHNTICDHLKKDYPSWSDDKLFGHARLINAALMAKIHTVEWTPGILATPALRISMNSNWWGILGKSLKDKIGRIGDGEILSGIIGSPVDHHAAPYYLTEEFVSVYRLHPLIPDDFDIYGIDGSLRKQSNFFDASGKRTRGVVEEIGMVDLFYSMGIAHPGAITLHNYPKFLQQLRRDNGEVLDLAAVDILRDRERGVPRYNKFRELIGRDRVKSFEEITSNPTWQQELKQVYNNDIDSVDLMVGMFAEDLPEGFGFSDTAFRIFILMASRRLKSDRFFTDDYRADVYTQFGLDWINDNTMLDVLKRHHPELEPSLAGVQNAFAPWKRL